MAPSSSLRAQLRKTTHSPLWVHPCFWSECHLTALHVKGFDSTHPLDRVVRRDGFVFEHLDPDNENDWPRIHVGPINGFPPRLEVLPLRWFASVDETLCRLGFSHRSRRERRFLHDRLPLQFGAEVVDSICESGLHGYPSYDEYPISFPIVSAWHMNCDNYDLFTQDPMASDDAIERHEKKRICYASTNAEAVSVLISMAQMQAEALRRDRFENTEAYCHDRLVNFHPVLLAMDCKTHFARFVTAHVSLGYLNSLADMSLPFQEDLVIEQSELLYLGDPKQMEQVNLGLLALVDDYLSLMPLFAQRKPLLPFVQKQSLFNRMLIESIDVENASIDCANSTDYTVECTKDTNYELVKRKPKTFKRASGRNSRIKKV